MLKDLFNKPKWQHRDPTVRREVIGELSEQELEQALSEILKDPDAGVRIAALKRASSLDSLRRASEKDSEEAVRLAAGERLRELLRQPSEDTHSLQERIAFLEGSDDQGLLEGLLHTAPHADLRRALLNLKPRDKALADVAVDDTDPKLRRLALKKLEDEALLERVMRDTRRHDKRTYRDARDKLQAIRLAKGDPQAVQRRRQQLCAQAEESAWTVDSDSDAKSLEEIVEEWKNLPVAPDQEVQKRFDAICQRGLNKGQAASQAAEEPGGEASETAGPDSEESAQQTSPAEKDESSPAPAATSTAKPPSAQRLIERAERLARDKKSGVQQRLLNRLKESWKEAGGRETVSEDDQKRFSEALGQLAALLEGQSKRNQEILEEIRTRLSEVERHLGQGELREARTIYRECARRFKGLPGLTRKQRDSMRSRLKAVHAGVRELKDWHHWGNNQLRLRLIESMEALAEKELHPEELNKRIKAARSEWMRLEESEKLPDDRPHYASGPGLWRRFHAACNRAYEPCKAFFKERAEERKAKTAEMQGICKELEQVPELEGDPPDWRPLDNLIRKGARSLSRLHEVDPKKRGAMARRIRKALKQLDDKLKEVQKPHEKVKKDLIESAKALAGSDDLGQATAEIRKLQMQWKESGVTVRHREQTLWKEFRAASNAVYEQYKEQRKAEDKAQQEQNRELFEICKKIEDLARLDEEALLKAEEDFDEARRTWEKAESRSPGLERRYVRACGRFTGKLKAVRRREATLRKRAQAQARIKALADKAELCAQLEALQGLSEKEAEEKAKEARERWEEMPELSKDDEARMRRRLQGALAGLGERPEGWDGDAEKHLGEADLLCVRMEMLAGIDSPPESAEVRMRYQMSRLSSALVDREKPANPQTEAREIQHEIHLLGPLPDQQAQAVRKRFQKAVEAFNEE